MRSTKAQHLEDWLIELEAESAPLRFTSREYADWCGIDRRDATYNIQAYMRAQLRGDTIHLIRREEDTRTSTTVWAAGVKVKDARGLGKAMSSDVKRRVRRHFVPTLQALAERNPRAAKQAGAQIDATLDGLFAIMDSAFVGMMPDE